MTSYTLQRPIYISAFRVVRPLFEIAQTTCLEWLGRAHFEAECQLRGEDFNTDEQVSFQKAIDTGLRRFGCSAAKISKRGYDLADFHLTNWEDMKIFSLHECASGRGIHERMVFFQEQTDSIMEEFYSCDAGESGGSRPCSQESPRGSGIPGARVSWSTGDWENSAPGLAIHVSCTGYGSPNATQRLISRRNWSRKTESTQAYHMGCYAALPGLRQASMAVQAGYFADVDIIHNEMCTLHFDPSLHSPEQLVVQSLFADGHIAYRVTARKPSKQAFRVLASLEEIIPNSLDDMTWVLASNSFRMTLAREVPQKVADAVPEFVQRLYREAGLSAAERLQDSVAALHPGGPRIIDGLKDVLRLHEEAIADSRKILFQFGNMSSATMPHIFDSIANRSEIKSGTLVLGLAFGPGLTMVGVLLQKI